MCGNVQPPGGFSQNEGGGALGPTLLHEEARQRVEFRTVLHPVNGITTMSELPTEKIIGAVTSFYLESHDFNGIPAAALAEQLGSAWQAVHPRLKELIDDDLVGVLYEDTAINSHVIRVGFEPKETQIAKLAAADLHQTCIYPRPKHLAAVVDTARYIREPYKLCLALGEPQLAHRSFDLSVLENYRNDPRYHYENNDINGSISVRDRASGSHGMEERDEIFLQTFGFSYDDDMNRAVAVYLRYLADLSSDHQQVWKAKELQGKYLLHPDYYRSSIIGDWGERIPIFDALLAELRIINQMATAMGHPPLFRDDYGEHGVRKPQKFSFLIRPTLEEFNAFVLLLDKMLSDNINKAFFRAEVADETHVERGDGKVEVRQKGSLQIIDEWVRKFFRPDDWQPWQQAIAALRDVRKRRQKPAHAVDENVFDQQYFKEQRDLIIRAYEAVRTIRLMFENHPKVAKAAIEIPEWLRDALIWTY
jgi:hypothetical protein